MFAFAVHGFVELLEDELLHRTLVREMQELKTELSENPQAAPPSSSGLSGFIVRTPEDLAKLPPELRSLADGVHEDVLIRGESTSLPSLPPRTCVSICFSTLLTSSPGGKCRHRGGARWITRPRLSAVIGFALSRAS